VCSGAGSPGPHSRRRAARPSACASAILAYKQASISPASGPAADPLAAELAEQLLALWRAVLAPRGVASYAIFEELDLTLTQVKALTALSAGELTVKDLAERLGLSLPGASRAVDALVDRGLLGRREDPSDRRMKRLRCTAAGREALTRLDEARLAGVAQFTATLPAAQRKRLSGALRPILEDLQHSQEERP
jgi:DNA-binding MarR family transcriptional regulator